MSLKWARRTDCRGHAVRGWGRTARPRPHRGHWAVTLIGHCSGLSSPLRSWLHQCPQVWADLLGFPAGPGGEARGTRRHSCQAAQDIGHTRKHTCSHGRAARGLPGLTPRRQVGASEARAGPRATATPAQGTRRKLPPEPRTARCPFCSPLVCVSTTSGVSGPALPQATGWVLVHSLRRAEPVWTTLHCVQACFAQGRNTSRAGLSREPALLGSRRCHLR